LFYFGSEGFQVCPKASLLSGVVEGPVGHAMAVGLEVMGKPLYAVQEGEHFLAVVRGVAEFFFGFKQGVDDVFARAVKPGMLGVELVSQDEPQNHGFGVFLESPRQRSEQNLT
jgi:hypothetical protein